MTKLRLSNVPLSAAEVRDCEHAQRISSLHADLLIHLGPGTLIRRDERLAPRTTLRVGGPADLYVEPESEADLSTLLDCARMHGVPWVLLGRGSNLLVRDGGVRGLVIGLGKGHFQRCEIQGDRIHAGAGARLRDLAHAARRAGLAGLEFFEGIPGTLGGALRMNAGAMGRWTFDAVRQVRWMDRSGRIEDVEADRVPVTYRSCPALRDRIALGATLVGFPDDPEAIRNRMEEYSQRRWSTQPAQPSGGCTFKNPEPSLPAGRLVEELGLKGERRGAAMISDVHGNFFVNLGGASASDILDLVEHARNKARDERGVELELELEVWGED
jgi:UDP-N-acetylenolpyruvoylglucosamine reductase